MTSAALLYPCRYTFFRHHNWATSRENESSEIFDQVWLKPVCSATATSWSLEISDIETRGIILSRQWKKKVLIRLRGCAGWSAPLLFAYGISHIFAWPGPIINGRFMEIGEIQLWQTNTDALLCSYLPRTFICHLSEIHSYSTEKDWKRLETACFVTKSFCTHLKKVNRKVQGVPQSEAAVNPWHQEEVKNE